jgi:hypothetical protein
MHAPRRDVAFKCRRAMYARRQWKVNMRCIHKISCVCKYCRRSHDSAHACRVCWSLGRHGQFGDNRTAFTHGPVFTMFKKIEKPSACEMCSVVQFLNARNVKPADIHQHCEVYGEHAISDSMVLSDTMWCFMTMPANTLPLLHKISSQHFARNNSIIPPPPHSPTAQT